MIPIRCSKERLIQDIEQSRLLPIEEVPIVEYAERLIQFPFVSPQEPSSLSLFSSVTEPSWGEVAVSSSLSRNECAQVDYLLLGLGIHFYIDPTTFVAHGTCDGYPAVADWSAPWRAVWEILQTYRMNFTYQQRFHLLIEKLDSVAHVVNARTDKIDDAEKKKSGGEVSITPYLNRLNKVLELRHLDEFQAKSTTAPLVALPERMPIYSKWRKFSAPIPFERGLPIVIELVSEVEGNSWTNHAAIDKAMIAMHRNYVIPAGGFKIVISLKGYEVGDQKAAVFDRFKASNPALVPMSNGRMP